MHILTDMRFLDVYRCSRCYLYLPKSHAREYPCDPARKSRIDRVWDL